LRKPHHYDPTLLQTYQTIGDVPPVIAHHLGANVDALFQGEGGSLPSTVILDYAYGVAAYKTWNTRGDDAFDVMNDFRKEHYEHIPPLVRAPPDDPSRRRNDCGMADAMDELNMVLMYINGITPEMAAERRQKEIEQEEQAAQEVSQSKVREWRKGLDVE
jgi:hypothetical protein